jgi:hypothetical protein
LLTVLLGLASRKFGVYLPAFLTAYAGDALWALLVFWLIGFLFTRKPSHWVATSALVFSFGIEASQLYHAPWLDGLRSTTLGSLVLGHGFLWTDLLCYATGIGLGYLLEKVWVRNASFQNNQVDLASVRETVR